MSVAIARETEYSGRRTQEGYRGMCADSLDPGGEVRGCFVGCIIGMWNIAPFVLIIAAGRYIGFLVPFFFSSGCVVCGCGVQSNFLLF